MSLLEVKNVSKIYYTGQQFFNHKSSVAAVKNVSFDINEGECLGIVGESGSGKSTLGRLIVGLEPCTSGKIIFDGDPINAKEMKSDKRRKLQFVYQNSFEATNPRYTAGKLIAEPLRNFDHLHGEELHKREIDLLKTVGIPENEINKKAAAFSGGQLQRICIARALAASSKLIVLDEPLSSLDVSVQAQILNLLRDLKDEYQVSYILISHDLEVVYYLSDRLIVMFYGTIVEQIDDMALFNSLSHPYTIDLLESAKYEIQKKTQKKNNDISGKAGCVYAQRCVSAGQRCFTDTPELVEIEKKHKIACHFIDKR
jgi:oligopeptide/dipeptide ABC transporter ATP-binding protein